MLGIFKIACQKYSNGNTKEIGCEIFFEMNNDGIFCARTIYIPHQTGTAQNWVVEEKGSSYIHLMFHETQTSLGYLKKSWLHLHPEFPPFLSRVDIETQYSSQMQDNDLFALVFSNMNKEIKMYLYLFNF